MGQVVVAPLYVPKPAEENPWLGKPRGVAAILIAALIPTFPLHPTRQFNSVPEPGWVAGGGAIPQVLLQFPNDPPFTARGTRKFDYVPEPFWQGKPQPVSIVFTVPQIVVLPFHNRPWQGPIPEPNWVEGGGKVPAALLQLPAIPPVAAGRTRQFNSVPEPIWQGQPQPVPLSFVIPPGGLSLPFSNFGFRRFDNVAEPQPRLPSQPIPEVLLRLPAVPPFTAKGTRVFNVPDDMPWTMRGRRSAILFLPTVMGVSQILTNVIVRTRVVSNTRERVRNLANTIRRGNQ